nr:hypothetical protein [uncultured Tyzzerella sp.]
MNNIFKISMFITSFIPLWINIIILDLISIIRNKENILIEIFSIIIILGLNFICIIYIFYCINYIEKENNFNMYKISEVVHEKNMTSGYLFSYVLPLFIFDFTNWLGILQFSIYFFTLLFLCMRNNYVYINIIMEILGYKFFSCEIKMSKDSIYAIVISNDELLNKSDSYIKLYDFNKPYYLHKKIKSN